jgi:hypothetical protein
MNKNLRIMYAITALMVGIAAVLLYFHYDQPNRDEYFFIAIDLTLGPFLILIPRTSKNEHLKSRKKLLTVLGAMLLASGIALVLMKLLV